VNNVTKARRGARLRIEASNCLTIAVREETADIAAQRIDEAARLMRRSTELVQPETLIFPDCADT
jgi:hypothetical protein